MRLLLDPDPPVVAAGGTSLETTPQPKPAAAAPVKPAEKDKGKETVPMPGLTAFAAIHGGEDRDKAIDEADKGKTADKVPDKKAPKDEKGKPQPKKKAVPVGAAQPLSGEQIAEAAARGVATALVAAKPAEKKDAAPDPLAKLPAEEKERIEVLTQMEKAYPERYKGLADRYSKDYLNALDKLETYSKQWEKDNPGKKFNEDDPEHEQFMAENVVPEDWEDHHFTRAAVRVEAEKMLAGEREKTNSKLSEYDKAEALRQAEPTIRTSQHAAAKGLWGAFGEDFAAIVTDQGIDQAKLQELQKADPVSFAHRLQAANDIDFEVAELHRLMNVKGYAVAKEPTRDDPQFAAKNAVYRCHKNLADFAAQMEADMLAKPTEDRRNQEGKDFIESAKFYDLPKAERAKHWTLTEADLTALRALDLASKVQQTIDIEDHRFRQLAEARGIKVPEKNGQVAKPAEAARDEKPITPSSSAESRMAAARGTGKNESIGAMELWWQRHQGIVS